MLIKYLASVTFNKFISSSLIAKDKYEENIIINKSKNIIIETLKILDDENIFFIKVYTFKFCLPCKKIFQKYF